jgi:hypothetical protein
LNADFVSTGDDFQSEKVSEDPEVFVSTAEKGYRFVAIDPFECGLAHEREGVLVKSGEGRPFGVFLS